MTAKRMVWMIGLDMQTIYQITPFPVHCSGGRILENLLPTSGPGAKVSG